MESKMENPTYSFREINLVLQLIQESQIIIYFVQKKIFLYKCKDKTNDAKNVLFSLKWCFVMCKSMYVYSESVFNTSPYKFLSVLSQSIVH